MEIRKVFEIGDGYSSLKLVDYPLWDEDDLDHSHKLGEIVIDPIWRLNFMVDSVMDHNYNPGCLWLGIHGVTSSPFEYYDINFDVCMEFISRTRSVEFNKSISRIFEDINEFDISLISNYEDFLIFDHVVVGISNIKFKCLDKSMWKMLYEIEDDTVLSWQSP